MIEPLRHQNSAYKYTHGLAVIFKELYNAVFANNQRAKSCVDFIEKINAKTVQVGLDFARSYW